MELLQRQVDGIKDELQVGWSHVRGWGGVKWSCYRDRWMA